MKKSIKILSIALLFSLVFLVEPTFAGNIQGLNFGAKEISGNTSIAGAVNEVGFKMIDIVRYIFSGVLVIVVMYFGMQMIMSMGSNEEDITSAKNGF
ncbi:hypothetical protein KGV52_01450, partial [Candidatus Gracilibacteria bacterium]|nr:hypothetical protein [Candidatus Gracilibacteria bacterium]